MTGNMMGDPYDELSVVTTCKGRLSFLQRSLPRFLAQRFEGEVAYRVVVVDYGCPDGAAAWCREHFDDPRLVVVSVRDDVEWFNLPRARNVGVRFAGNGVLALLDGDVLLRGDDCLDSALRTMREGRWDRLNHSPDRHDDGRPCLNGQVLLRADALRALRGYDERLRYWGADDIDLYRRSTSLGHAWQALDLGMGGIAHTDEERVRFVEAATRDEALERNRELLRARGDALVNPFGWGLTLDHDVWSPGEADRVPVRIPYESTVREADGEPGCVCDVAGWCERHRCEKSREQNVACLADPDRRREWEEGRGPGQRMEVRGPGERPLTLAPGECRSPLDGRGSEESGRSLLPLEAFAPIFEPLRGRRVALARMPGNVGDALIRVATYQIAERFGVDCFEADPESTVEADEWVIAGGGNMGGRFGRCQAIRRRVLEHGLPVTVLPQTFSTVEYLPYSRVYVRELESLRYRPDAMLAPDLALGYEAAEIDVRRDLGEGLWLRQDGEGLFRDVSCAGDPARVCRTPDDYLRLAARHEHVITDRLHFAIAALIGGRRATLLPNRSMKNHGMYHTWLEALGGQWLDHPPGTDPPPQPGPGLLRRAANLGRAVARHVADGMQRVPREVLRDRLEICRNCPACDTSRMVCRDKACGCFLRTKATWRSERCPRGKWPR
jgi:hypothetical protein